MVKDTNTRNMVTLTKEQAEKIGEFADAYQTSSSKIIASLVAILLSYEVGNAIGDWFIQELNSRLEKPKSKRRNAASGVNAPKRATHKGDNEVVDDGKLDG